MDYVTDLSAVTNPNTYILHKIHENTNNILARQEGLLTITDRQRELQNILLFQHRILQNVVFKKSKKT